MTARLYRTSLAALVVLFTLLVAGCGRAGDSSGLDVSSGGVDLVAFASVDGRISTVRGDGTLLHEIASPDVAAEGGFRGVYSWPVWSPDASTLLYSAVLPAGGSGVEVSLRKVPATAGHESVVYNDAHGTTGIGDGVPHFAYWSPDGTRVAVIAGTPDGLTGEVVDIASGKHMATLADGAPIYYSWAADSNSILVHHLDFLRLYSFGDGGNPVGAPKQIGGGSTDYFAPQFSPDGTLALHAQTLFGHTRVTVTDPASSPPSQTQILETNGRAAFGWSPDGLRIAVLSEEADGVFNRLTVLTPAGSELFRIERGSLVSFWWSPDATRLAVVSLTEDASHNTRLAFDALDVRDQSEARLATLLATDEFLFVQYFFDQYARSMQIWSPDSHRLVVFGALGDRLGQSASYGADAATSRNGVWVIDVTGSLPPKAVGEGTIGAWSPK